MFDWKLYNSFLRNTCQRWQIVLNDGVTVEGVPTTGSTVDMANPRFNFHDGKRSFQIPYAQVVRATPVKADSSLPTP